MKRWSAKEDGKTHINVYSKGATAVGRWASNFQESPFMHPKYGHFRSIEGLWYWLSVKPDHPRRDELRHHSGYAAKLLGRELRGQDWVNSDAFEADIKLGLRAKFSAYPEELAAFQKTTLPLAHYYVMGRGIHYVSDGEWILEELERIRREGP